MSGDTAGRHHDYASSRSETSSMWSCRSSAPADGGQSFGSIESVKAVSELFAPVAARWSKSTTR